MSLIGRALGDRYRIDAVIGSGGMATVYRGWDLRLDRAVAVKVLAHELAADPSFVARFQQEARTMARVHHPSLVAVHDVSEGGDLLYIVMELVDGESLAERMRREHVLSPEALGPILGSVASGLAALHALGLVHRDVKPHNILLPTVGAAKLADFGLTRGDGTTSLTLPGTAIGTLGYLAPELLRGLPATTASDVYAFGVTAYEALTGQRPANGPAEAGTPLLTDRPPALPSALAPWLGTAFDGPLLAALGPAPGRPDIISLGAQLTTASETWARGGVLPSASPPTDLDATTVRLRVADPGHRPSRPAIGVALLVAAILIVGVFVAWSLTHGPTVPAGPTASPSTAAPSPSPTAVPSPTATAVPTVTPTASPAPSTAAQVALGALDAFDATVADLQGGPGALKGKDANSLTDLARQVRSAVGADDAKAARDAAARLVDQSQRVAHGLSADKASRLTSAAQAVQRAVTEL